MTSTGGVRTHSVSQIFLIRRKNFSISEESSESVFPRRDEEIFLRLISQEPDKHVSILQEAIAFIIMVITIWNESHLHYTHALTVTSQVVGFQSCVPLPPDWGRTSQPVTVMEGMEVKYTRIVMSHPLEHPLPVYLKPIYSLKRKMWDW